MNPLELNKDSEIVANSPIETVSSESIIELDEISPEKVETAIIESESPKDITVSEPPKVEEHKLPNYGLLSKAELIDALKSILDGNVESIKEEVEIIKQSFYKRSKAEIEESKKNFIDAGGELTEFKPEKDELEEVQKTLLNEYRSKKAAHTASLEKEKEQNLLQKQHILMQMKVLSESNDDVSTHINEFRNLQQKWKSIGQVPAQYSTDMWKQYNLNQETFWDLIKINNELREYDFKKNLESKTQLCEAAEVLDGEEDVIIAFQKLQKLHEEWHELGPVSRDLREQVWARFKEASSIINKKHQTYFDTIRKIEDENQIAKEALCEKIEAFDFSGLNTYKTWDEATQTVLKWQDEWRTLGFAPRKVNQRLFDRYRKSCDAFFAAKAAFYKESKGVLNQNLDKKKSLCEQAESFKDSKEWKETSDKLIQLQKEWKTIGPVPKKVSDELWKRFIAACDFFFEQKNKENAGQKTAENENLLKKKDLIERIKLVEQAKNSSETLAKLRELMDEWGQIGHVPFKEKDKIYKEFRAEVDKQFDKLNIDASQRRLDSFKNNLKDMSSKGENKLYREREKLVRAYEHLKSEISTYENNIGFFTSTSKKGGGMIKEMERKIEALKEESKLVEQKINLIDQSSVSS